MQYKVLLSSSLYCNLLNSTVHYAFSHKIFTKSPFSPSLTFLSLIYFLLSSLLSRYMDSEGRVKMLTAAIRAELLATIESMAKVRYDVWCGVVCNNML